MMISINPAKQGFAYSLAIGAPKRTYWINTTTTQKINWNLRGTKILSKAELDIAPEYLYKTLSEQLDKKSIYNVEECLGNMKIVFSSITKQKTLIEVKEPFSHEEIIKFYSDGQIQELLQRISLYANRLLKNDPKKALNLIENGLKMRSDLPTSEIAITLKCQYAKGLLLCRSNSVEEIKKYVLNLGFDAENSDVAPSVMASIRNLQGFIALREAMDVSNAEQNNGYKNKSSIRKFRELKHGSRLYFHEAARLDPNNKTHEINALAIKLFIFGASTCDSKIVLSKSGTIKLIPTLENFLINGRSVEEDFYLMLPISAGIYHKLAELRDEIASSKFTPNSPFLNTSLKALEKEKTLPTDKGEVVLEKLEKAGVKVLTKTLGANLTPFFAGMSKNNSYKPEASTVATVEKVHFHIYNASHTLGGCVVKQFGEPGAIHFYMKFSNEEGIRLQASPTDALLNIICSRIFLRSALELEQNVETKKRRTFQEILENNAEISLLKEIALHLFVNTTLEGLK